MYRVYRYVLPEVKAQLNDWRKIADQIPNDELRKQAIDSMTTKQFHCQGGSVYAVANLPQRHVLIPLIVAFQTISDYLDNLCDRSVSMDADDFRLLHQSMLDAVDPSASLQNYYAKRTDQDDGDYLHQLVKTCQSCICLLPKYDLVKPYVKELVSYYCDLQVYKHIKHDLRENQLLTWWETYSESYPELHWNEFAAATGSTLGVFMLFLAATDENLSVETVGNIRKSYFPHICGLHILLDYLIDQEEDEQGGDLNFCSYYENNEMTFRRIEFIFEQANRDLHHLPNPSFHQMIIEGLLALYLSDPKVKNQTEVKLISKKLMKKSPFTRLFFWMNSVWIRKLK
ncbi:tetraprenyl-beta-curcumene synthase family protein [Chengkuizengella sp. 2205SS18-9]|uniref:Tetraprenyl-beta-curcumene synthase family protein n=2 Tax=Chengkuizengella axinellae TaxID=3064388 RepID=A0ABT9J0I0_9BACL|nr:tetraprenyl-beta-curcumene synthase family protein [Chengkuizengella sp. 2205SS18-9]MDP5274530.1 tetraprenyl-beta-curcumene synthase family protein [Chengkuizengella sp. 2205SS18-9]